MESVWRERLTRYRRSVAVAAGMGAATALVLAAANAGQAQERAAGSDESGFKTAVKRYAEIVPGSNYDYKTEPLLSVGDTVPETDDPAGTMYQMVGIPDGLGATRDASPGKNDRKKKDDGVRVFMNHEFTETAISRPTVDSSDAERQKGAFVSEYQLTKDGGVLSGRRAFDTVFQDNTLVGPAAEVGNTTRPFSRFCSAFMADSRVGFDRPIFLTGEETSRSGGATTTTSFDPAGSQTVAVFDNEAHALSDFGRFAKENTIVASGTGDLTVAFSTEDGPAGPESQLYMYVGEKDKSSSDPLERNGLVGGTLNVFVADDEAQVNEGTFQEGTLEGHFEPIPDARDLDETQLEARADAMGAFGFVRIEDGAFGPKKGKQQQFYFHTTGGTDGINRLGRGYELLFDPKNPEKTSQLQVVWNSDLVDAANGDISLSPDNMDVTKKLIASQEDGTSSSRPEMEERNRDGSIWFIDRDRDDASEPEDPGNRVVELVGRSEGGRDGTRTTSGIWETSGIVDTSKFFGKGTFLFDVQAHSPTQPPNPADQVEDGQLLLLKPSGKK